MKYYGYEPCFMSRFNKLAKAFFLIILLSSSLLLFLTQRKARISNLIDFSFSEFRIRVSRSEGKQVFAWRSRVFGSEDVVQKLKALLAGEFNKFSVSLPSDSTLIFSVILFSGGKENPHDGILGVFHRRGVLFFTVYPKSGMTTSHQIYFLLSDLREFFLDLIEKKFSEEIPTSIPDQRIFRERLEIIRGSS